MSAVSGDTVSIRQEQQLDMLTSRIDGLDRALGSMVRRMRRAMQEAWGDELMPDSAVTVTIELRAVKP